MAKYLIKHWVNVDVIAEKVVDETEIDITKNDLKKHKTPDGTFSFVMINNSEKIKVFMKFHFSWKFLFFSKKVRRIFAQIGKKVKNARCP